MNKEKNDAYTEFLNQVLKEPFVVGVSNLGDSKNKDDVSTEKKEKTDLDLLNFMIPDIETSPMFAETDKCNHCGDNSNLEYHNCGAWTNLFTCYNCGYLNYIIFSDKMGGRVPDTVKLFKIHPKAKTTL